MNSLAKSFAGFASVCGVILILGTAGEGCHPLPGSFPSDVLTEFQCVEADVEAGHNDPLQIGIDCAIPELALVADALESLLGSPQWTAAHPTLVPVAQRALDSAKAHLALENAK